MNAKKVKTWLIRGSASIQFLAVSYFLYIIEKHGVAYPDITLAGHTFSSFYAALFILATTSYQAISGRFKPI